MSPRLAYAIHAATVAGRSTLAHFQNGVAVELKSDQTPVTVADRGAERLVRELIADRFPEDSVLGEEEGGDATEPDRWVVDPIDGTKSFICGVPLYATLLSYEVNRQPILGVAYFPALNEIFYAETGQGSFSNGRPIKVSERETVENSILCCGGHRSLVQHGRWDGFQMLSETALATRSWGDAYGHCLVAAGRVDAMVDPIVSRWDLSAVQIIVREAGGHFTRFDGGEPLEEDFNLEAVASNGRLHGELLQAFRK